MTSVDWENVSGALGENLLEFWLALSQLVGGKLDRLIKWLDMKPRNRFIFIIRGSVSEIRKEVLVEKSDAICEVGVNSYTGSLSEGWIKEVGWIDRNLRKIKEERWIIYEEPGENEAPPMVKEAVTPQNSAQLLYAVHTFKGVEEGLTDEFKEASGWDNIPGWVLIVGLAGIILIAGYVAYTEGIITL